MDKLVKILTDMRTDIDELVGDGKTDRNFKKKLEDAVSEIVQTNVQSIVQNRKFKNFPEQGDVDDLAGGGKKISVEKKSPKSRKQGPVKKERKNGIR